jgi:monoterpene epsilon-lactone hydrolase
MPSKEHADQVAIFERLQLNKVFEDGQSVREALASARKVEKDTPFEPIPSGINIEKDTSLGFPVFIITSALSSNANDILYFHGGGYVFQASDNHWLFSYRLARETGARILFALYPLGPEHKPAETYGPLLEWWREQNGRPVTLMGDSAGGGMCVHLAQDIRNVGLTLPKDMILISPFLSGDSKPAPVHDPVVSLAGAKECAVLWGEDDTELLKRNNKGLTKGRILMFGGTADCLCWHARDFKKMLPETEYIELEGVFHIYPLFPIPEADEAMTRIVAFLNGN